uniref:Uncharacterized protein n=1 Tax=Arundo donax TaxID=35708 RepID=A0A0A8XTA9_ARUDO
MNQQLCLMGLSPTMRTNIISLKHLTFHYSKQTQPDLMQQ